MSPALSTSRRGVRRARRARITVALAVVVAASMVLVGVLDHRHKATVMNRLEVDEWYCMHDNTHCFPGNHSWDVERRWNKRETAYIAVIAAMAAVAVGASIAGLRSRRAV
jgi:hypothetical protein